MHNGKHKSSNPTEGNTHEQGINACMYPCGRMSQAGLIGCHPVVLEDPICG
jgi:hypothetical protein